MKLRPKIDAHDYETKKGHVRPSRPATRSRSPSCSGGASSTAPSWATALQKLAEDVTELGFVESNQQDGRNMTMVIGPHKKKAGRRPR